MPTVVVFAELSSGQLKKSALELLSAARESGQSIHAVALGKGAQNAVATFAAYGVEQAYIGDDPAFDIYNPEVFAAAFQTVFETSHPKFMLASASQLGRDLFPRLAARFQGALASDCTELRFQGPELHVRKPMYAGKCTAAVQFAGEGARFVLMRANQLSVVAASGAGATPKVVNLQAKASDLKTLVQNVVRGTSEKLDLSEASVIVSGGRGLRDAEGYKILEPLADVLGATLGASRAIVDAGWVPHNMQVGQTGKTVAPTLYIACGISGAIQHLAGMSGSKVIVAINKDANAPIFQKATYGIVGDVFEIVPALTAEFKKLLQ